MIKALIVAFVALLPAQTLNNACQNDCVISQAGLTLIQHFEGYMPFPYDDAVGIKTVGFGHVILPGERFTYPLLPEQANDLLKKDAGKAGKGVNRKIRVPLRQGQFDGLTSFTFNLGEAALGGSTLLKRVNARRHAEVPAEFMKWNKARVRGVLTPLPGLTRRREAEAALYAH